MMLMGTYTGKLGDGDRLVIPAKLRNKLGDHLVVAQGFEGCLIVVPADQWESLTLEAGQGPYVTEPARKTTRFLMSGATEVNLDEQGRFVLPLHLREYAKILNEVITVGTGRWVEIWAKERWQKESAYLEEHASEIAEKLGGTF